MILAGEGFKGPCRQWSTEQKQIVSFIVNEAGYFCEKKERIMILENAEQLIW